MKAKEFVRKFNQNFGKPFLPDGFSRAEIFNREKGKNHMNIRIGDRDVDFEFDGSVSGADTQVGEGSAWKIDKLEG